MILGEEFKLDTTEYSRVYKALETDAKKTVDYFLENNTLTGEQVSGVIASTIETLIDKSLQSITDSSNLAMSIIAHKEEMAKIKTEVMLMPKTLQYDNIQEGLKSLNSTIGDYAIGGLIIPSALTAESLRLSGILTNTEIVVVNN